MLGISQFAHEFMCLYCGEPNPAAEWRTMGDMVPYYCQREPGKHNLTMTCPHCDKAWYVVWDNNPGEIELLLPIGNEPQVSATTHDGASHAQGARLDPALPEEVDDEEDRDPQQEEIQNFASRLMSDDQSTRDEVIDTAREMATTGDDTGLRALEKAIKDLSCNQDCTFHTPGFHVQRSGDSEGARYEILRLAERKQLLNDPEHSQDLIARVGSADIHSVWQNVSETGGEDEYRAYQLLASHIVTHAELIKHGREVESAELDEDDEEYRLAPELDLPDTSTINVSADAKAFICVCKSCGTIYALGVNSVVVTGKDTLYLQGQKPGLFDADTYPPDFIGLIEGKESWLRKEPPPQVEPLPDDIAISMESRERRRWLCAKCQGVQEYRWPGRQERPMTADPVTSGESDILGPLAAYVERMVTPGAEVCDVCGIGVFESAGYLLTTRQVVSTPAYWRSYYRQHEARFRQADVMSYTEFCNAGEIRQACCKGIAAQTTPWMVCERCIGMFKVDRSKTRDYALKWWAGGKTASVRTFRPPGTGPAPRSVKLGQFSNDAKTALGCLAVILLVVGAFVAAAVFGPDPRAETPVATPLEAPSEEEVATNESNAVTDEVCDASLEDEVRLKALEELKQLGAPDDEYRERLHTLLQDKLTSHELRTRVATLLTEWNLAGTAAGFREMINAKVTSKEFDDPALPHLIGCYEQLDPDADLLPQFLPAIRSQQADAALRFMMIDKVKTAAVWTTSGWNDPNLVATLLIVARDRDDDLPVRKAAAEVLLAINHRKTVRYFNSVFGDNKKNAEYHELIQDVLLENSSRMWAAATGGFQVDAVLLDEKDGKVQLLKLDRTTIWVPTDRLSQADQDYVTKFEWIRSSSNQED